MHRQLSGAYTTDEFSRSQTAFIVRSRLRFTNQRAEPILQATRAVRTVDPAAHGRRSAAIGGGISSRRAITCSHL